MDARINVDQKENEGARAFTIVFDQYSDSRFLTLEQDLAVELRLGRLILLPARMINGFSIRFVSVTKK